jgi:hypothetical protein
MNTLIVFDSIKTICCVILIFVPFDRKRVRARWAKLVFFICGIVGTGRGVFCLAWDLGWFSLGREINHRLDVLLYHFVDGLILGFLLSLIFSGQLTGIKRASDTKQPPNTALEPTATAPSVSTNK